LVCSSILVAVVTHIAKAAEALCAKHDACFLLQAAPAS
jgi:hypothetical protein